MRFDIKMLDKKTLRITKVFKTVFLVCFAVIATFGLIPEKRGKTPQTAKSSQAVFFHSEERENLGFAFDSASVWDTGTDTATEASVFSAVKDVAPPEVSAVGAALVCADTGELIFGKNADCVLPMASTTKIMTALVVLENCRLDYVFTVPKEACGIEGSSVYLYPGEQITVENLLYGLLLESGNDAATALAIACCGSEEKFVFEMNRRAKEMGLCNTSFANPHGLSAENHFTSAKELAIITYYAMKNPDFKRIVSTISHSVENPDGSNGHYFVNHNKMLRTYNGANGVKTGYTVASGRCLVTSAERENGTFIAVTLDDRNDWKDHAAMLDYAFSVYCAKEIFKSGELEFCFDGVTYSNAEKICSLFRKDEKESEDMAGNKNVTVTNDETTVKYNIFAELLPIC